MTKYIAIGHWDFNKNITCAASEAKTKKDFREELKANGFTAYITMSEQKLNEYKAADIFGRMEMIPSRNRHAIDIEDYLNECMDIIESKLAAC